MSSKPATRIHHTLAFRLTLWYAGIFALTASLAFLFFYATITSTLRQRVDRALIHQADDLLTVSSLQGIEEVKQTAIMQAQAAGMDTTFEQPLIASPGSCFAERLQRAPRSGSPW